MKKNYLTIALLLWIGLSAQIFAQSNLVFTEIMYNPAESGTDSTEYVEIFNNGDASIALNEYYISNGFVFIFPEISIPAQGFIVLCNDSMAMVNTYGYEGAYEWTSGGLSNGGEPIALKDADGNLMDSLRYDDNAAWPNGADQGGSSLVLCDPNSDNILPENWTVSTLSAGIMVNEIDVKGSPGATDPGCSCESYSEIEIAACDAYQSPSGNYIWMETGLYQDTILNEAECDSIMTLDLTINESKAYTDIRASCVPFEWIDGITYTESNNTAFVNLVTVEGCDSLVTLDLIISENINVIDDISACGPYTWLDGIEYTENNSTATQIYTTVDDCDSIVTLNLVISSASESTHMISTCESYEWIDGNTYNESNNMATFTIENAAGCDSVITLDLIILEASEATDTQVACETYEWIDGNTYTESNNMATFTIENAEGCDSVITLDLTILDASEYIDVQEACGTFDWIDGNTYAESNNTASFSLENTEGCDSIIYLDLTIFETSASIDVINSCESFEWIDGNVYAESNSTATFTLENEQGCDSIIILDLTIHETYVEKDDHIACVSFDWIDGVTYTEDNNTASYTFESIWGCDSILNLDLTIISVDTSISVTDGNLIIANATNATFAWIDCQDGHIIVDDPSMSQFMPDYNGHFAVIVTQNECSDTSECVMIQGIGIEERTGTMDVQIFPNPATDKISISLEKVMDVDISICNLEGKEIITYPIKGKSNFEFSIMDLEAGVYFVKILSKEGFKIEKLIKQ